MAHEIQTIRTIADRRRRAHAPPSAPRALAPPPYRLSPPPSELRTRYVIVAKSRGRKGRGTAAPGFVAIDHDPYDKRRAGAAAAAGGDGGCCCQGGGRGGDGGDGEDVGEGEDGGGAGGGVSGGRRGEKG